VDPKRYDAGDDSDFVFKTNYEMIGNVFRTGIARNNPKLMAAEAFPSDSDRLQKSIRTFTVTKLYDSEKNRWKTEADIEGERYLSRQEQLKKVAFDMTVNFSFSVNEVKLNSGLNTDVLDALKTTQSELDLAEPFVADYELN